MFRTHVEGHRENQFDVPSRRTTDFGAIAQRKGKKGKRETKTQTEANVTHVHPDRNGSRGKPCSESGGHTKPDAAVPSGRVVRTVVAYREASGDSHERTWLCMRPMVRSHLWWPCEGQYATSMMQIGKGIDVMGEVSHVPSVTHRGPWSHYRLVVWTFLHRLLLS